MPDNYLEVPSPFALPRPSDAWLQTLRDFDGDLVLFPSQKTAVFRLARRAHRSGGITASIFKRVGAMLHPDTKIMFDHHLVAVTSVPRAAVLAPCEKLCAQLIPRDTWRFGPREDAAALALERMEHDEQQAQSRAWHDESRVRHRAARVGFLHRTGARVSLIAPRRPAAGSASPPTPATDTVATVSATEGKS